MKIHFANKNKKRITTYTYELLKDLAKKNSHTITNINDCDIVALSLTSFYEIDKLRILRKQTKKPIIVGGHVCNNPATLLRYADYVNLGQGFEFFKDCKTINDITKQSYIITKEKKEGTTSDFIDWKKLPVIQIGKNSYSYLYSMGCQHKCKFCLTSWQNKYQTNPKKVDYIRAKIGKKNQLYLISNDMHRQITKRYVADVVIKDYIKNPSIYKNIQLLRLGVEGTTEKSRKELGKYITDEELRQFFYLTKQQKKRVNLFFLGGFNTQKEWEDFKYILGEDYDASPKIGIIINYFSAVRGTPLEKFDMHKIITLNIPKIRRIWKTYNARVVVYHDQKLKPINSTIETFYNRADIKDVDNIHEFSKYTAKMHNIKDVVKYSKKYNIEKLLTDINNNYKVNTFYREAV